MFSGGSVEVGGVYYTVDLNTGKLLRQSREVEAATGRIERSFTAVAAAAATFVAALSIEGVIRRSIDASRAFERAVADLSAITGATGDALRELKDEAKLLGATTSASAGQVIEAMKLIASAKPELLETRGALAAVAKEAIALADASGMALPAAAEAVTLALNQFGEGADQAARFVNVLAAGAKFGASEIADTAIALKNSAVSAASARVSFEEVNAAIQALAAGGIKGGEAGTALRNVILKLENSASRELKPSINGLAGALDALNAKNLTSTQLTKLFGLENVNAAQALLRASERVRELTADLTGTSTAYDQAAINTATFDNAIKRMNNTLDLALIKLGDELKPIAASAAGAITSMAQAFIDGAPAIKTATTVLEVALVALAAVIAGKVVTSITILTLLLARALPVIGAATIATKGLAAIMAALGGPVGIAAGALALLVLNWDKIAGSAKNAADISEDAAQRIAAASRKSAGAAKRDLEEQLAEIERQLPAARRAPTNLRMGTFGGVGSPEDIADAEARVKALEDAAQRTRAALAEVDRRGRRPANEGGGRYVPPEAAAPPGPTDPADPDAANKAAQARARAQRYLTALRLENLSGLERINAEEAAALADNAELQRQDAANAGVYAAARLEIQRAFVNKRNQYLEQELARWDQYADQAAAQRERAAEAERQAELQREADLRQGRDFALSTLGEADPVLRLQMELERKSALLLQYAQQDQENAELYARARVALEQMTAQQITALLQQEQLDRVAAQSQLLGSTANLFDGAAQLAKQFAGEQSGTFRALFAISKGFAIADAGLKLNMAILQALADPTALTPAQKLANYAAIASAGGALLSSISSVSFGGGRQYGGGVNAGSLYRVNETGQPEMFVGRAGQQFMMPTTDGRVVPADQLGASGGWTLIVNQVPAGMTVSPDSIDADRRVVTLSVREVARQFRENEGEAWASLTRASNVRGRI